MESATQNTGSSQPASSAAREQTDPSERMAQAQAVVRRNVLWASGVGLVPIPVVDFVGVSAVQLKMLRELTALYDVKFSEQIAKKVIAALVAGLGSAGIGTALALTFVKSVPLVGTSLGAVSLPLLSGAFTLATGRVFVTHFESGGTLLDFNPKALREHFRAEFERAKATVAQMDKTEAKKPTQGSGTSVKA